MLSSHQMCFTIVKSSMQNLAATSTRQDLSWPWGRLGNLCWRAHILTGSGRGGKGLLEWWSRFRHSHRARCWTRRKGYVGAEGGNGWTTKLNLTPVGLRDHRSWNYSILQTWWKRPKSLWPVSKGNEWNTQVFKIFEQGEAAHGESGDEVREIEPTHPDRRRLGKPFRRAWLRATSTELLSRFPSLEGGDLSVGSLILLCTTFCRNLPTGILEWR